MASDTFTHPFATVPRMRYRIVHTTNFSYSEAVPLCQNEVHLKPRDTLRQTCSSHRLEIKPAAHSLEECRDYFGNNLQFFTIQDRHEELTVTSHCSVRLAASELTRPSPTGAWQHVVTRLREGPPAEHWDVRQFAFDSPLVTATPELAAFAAPSFPQGRPWLDGVLDLMGRIYSGFTFDPTATSISTPLSTVLQMKRGVCQDFAHLQIGCLRALGLPARYVSGYLLTSPPPGKPRLVGADASHAWLSAWCPEYGWIDFDPTNNVVPSLGHITVAWGRDYSDVCPIQGVFIGGGQHSMRVSVDVEAIGD